MSPVPLNELATEIEAKPCTTDPLVERVLCPYEAAEKACLLTRRDTDAMILDAQKDCVRSVLLT